MICGTTVRSRNNKKTRVRCAHGQDLQEQMFQVLVIQEQVVDSETR